jgi:Mce-associated membrane protein
MAVKTDNEAAEAESRAGAVEEEPAADVMDEQAKEADAQPESDGQPRSRPWRRRLLAGIVVVIFIAALCVSAFLGWASFQQRELTRAGQQAQQAAIAYAQILTSIDSNRVDDNFNKVLDGATGEFKDMYTQSSVQLRQLLIDNKASAHGAVVESAIQSETKNKVVVLLFVDQSVSNASVPDARIDRSRIKMTMDFVDGRWRAGQVELP